MRKRLPLLLAVLALMTAVIALTAGTALANGNFQWQGNGFPNPSCTSNSQTMLWIFNTGDSGVIPTTLHINGEDFTGWTQSGGSTNWHLTVNIDATDFPPVTVSVDYTGTLGGNPVLTLSGCDEGNPPAETSTITTEVHSGTTDSGSPVVVDDANPASLGGSVHDSADLELSSGAVPDGSYVVFSFWTNHNCSGDASDSSGQISVTGGPSISLDPELAEGPLGAGQYSYAAAFTSGDVTKLSGSTSSCEPFTVNKADVDITTNIHDANHNVVSSVPNGATVHDTATFSNFVSGFAPDPSQVSFTFYTNGTCYGTGSPVANVGADQSTGDPRSAAVGPLSSGAYSFTASFAGDDNYNSAGPATCEPLAVRTFGKTMGFWGNRNGQALLPANPNVTLGINSSSTCYIVVSSKAISLTILPLTLNGTSILTNCLTVASRDSGINTSSLNTLLAQTLALQFNIQYISGFTGQTIGALGCTAVGTLTSSSTVNNTLTYANSLIGNSKSGGTIVTQSQIGALNTLLGCINSEA